MMEEAAVQHRRRQRLREVMDEIGFEGWARAVSPRLVRLATLLTGNDHEARDVVQDVLLACYRSWPRISRLDHVDAYAARMVINRHLATARSRGRRVRREHLAAVPEARPAPDDQVADADALVRALKTLGENQRAVVLLRHVEGLSDADIAATLGCSASTVRSQSSRALAHLRAALTSESLT